MKSDSLAKHYGALTLEERFRLRIRAFGRGDKDDWERLDRACPNNQYQDYRARLDASDMLTLCTLVELLPSMGAIGTCYDNALMESFWSRVQVELLDRQTWSTRLELATALFEYLEIFHNRQRRHSSLGMLTPTEFEMRRATTATGLPA